MSYRNKRPGAPQIPRVYHGVPHAEVQFPQHKILAQSLSLSMILAGLYVTDTGFLYGTPILGKWVKV